MPSDIIRLGNKLIIAAGTRVLIVDGKINSYHPRKIIENWKPLWSIGARGGWIAGSSDNELIIWQGGKYYAHFYENSPVMDTLVKDDYLFSFTSGGDITVRSISRKRTFWHRRIEDGWIESMDAGNGLVAVGTWNGTVVFFDIKSGVQVGKIEAHTGQVNTIKITKKLIATGGADMTVKIWKLSAISEDTPRPLQTVYLYGKEPTALGWASTHLVIGCSDGNMWIWDLRRQKSILLIRGHTSPPTRINSYSTHNFVSATTNGEIFWWDIETGNPLWMMKTNPLRPVRPAIVGNSVITTHNDWSIYHLSPPTTTVKPLPPAKSGVSTIASDMWGNMLAVGYNNGKLVAWLLNRMINAGEIDLEEKISLIDVSPVLTIAAVVGNGNIVIWNPSRNIITCELKVDGTVDILRFDRYGKYLLVILNPPGIIVVDTQQCKTLIRKKLPSKPTGGGWTNNNEPYVRFHGVVKKFQLK